MHRQLTDTTRRRAERTIRTIVNDGPNTSAPIETNLLMRTVTWDFVPVSDPQRLWNWGWMEQPSVREFARQSLEKDGAIDDYALHELLVEKRIWSGENTTMMIGSSGLKAMSYWMRSLVSYPYLSLFAPLMIGM